MSVGFKNLIVWQKADQLAFEIYQITNSFPKEEQFGITSQIRRAALSIPTNIAEGSGRQHTNETKQFANIALGSLRELEYLLHFSLRLEFINEKSFNFINSISDEVAALLWKFHKSF